MSENRPALSATSDMPPVVPAESPPAPEPVQVPTPAPAPAPEPATPPEPTGPIATRFTQLAAQRREAEARADRMERTAAELGTKLETALAAITKFQQPPAPVTVLGSDRPVRDSFPDQESYEAAIVSWAGAQAAEKASAEFQRKQEEAEAARVEKARAEEETRVREAREAEEARRQSELEAAWEARRAKAVEKYPDFVELTGAASLPISLAMGHVIVTHEDGAEIAYYLAQNPKEAARIAGLNVPGQVFPAGHPQAGLPVPNAVAQAFEMGKIAARLAAPTAALSDAVPPAGPTVVTPPTVPILPAPPSPISGASAAATRREPSEMSMDEYAALRAPQLFAARTPGRAH